MARMKNYQHPSPRRTVGTDGWVCGLYAEMQAEARRERAERKRKQAEETKAVEAFLKLCRSSQYCV